MGTEGRSRWLEHCLVLTPWLWERVGIIYTFIRFIWLSRMARQKEDWSVLWSWIDQFGPVLPEEESRRQPSWSSPSVTADTAIAKPLMELETKIQNTPSSFQSACVTLLNEHLLLHQADHGSLTHRTKTDHWDKGSIGLEHPVALNAAVAISILPPENLTQMWDHAMLHHKPAYPFPNPDVVIIMWMLSAWDLLCTCKQNIFWEGRTEMDYMVLTSPGISWIPLC